MGTAQDTDKIRTLVRMSYTPVPHNTFGVTACAYSDDHNSDHISNISLSRPVH